MSEEQSLSEKLRAARQQQGKSIEEVHRQTGLSSDLLEGLETDRFDVVEPVFTRMSLRSYAEYLGLEADPLLEQYDRDHPAAAVPAPIEIPARETASRGTPSKSGSRLPIDASVLRIVALAISALAVFLLILYIFDDSTDAPPATDALPERPAPAVPSPPPPLSTDREEPVLESATQTAADEAAPAEDVTDAALPPPAADSIAIETTAEAIPQTPTDDGELPSREDRSTAPEGMAAEISESDAAPPDETPGPEDIVPENRPAAEEDAPQISAEPAPSAAETTSLPTPVSADSLFQLEVEAVDSTWVQIRWDGSGIFEGTVPRGERRLWQARKFFLVRSGRAHGLRYWFQGQLLGDGRLGDPTRVLRFRAGEEGITLLGPDLQPLNTPPDADDQP